MDETQTESEVVVKAKEMGWRPLEEFPGDPDKFISAEEFVERGKTLMPILRKNNERLEREIGPLKQQVATLQQNLKEATEAMDSFREYASTAAKNAYEKAVNDIKAQKAQAAEEGDIRAVMKADDALEELRQNAPQPLKKITQTPASTESYESSPEFQAWRAETSWAANGDKEKIAYAASIGSYLRTQYPTLKGREFLDKVAEEVEQRFGKKPVNRTEGTSRQGGSSKGYESLPSEAKAACDRMGAKLVGKGKAFETQAEWRKQYVSDYFME